MTVLALETSTAVGSVVLLDPGGNVLFERTFRAERTHSAVIFGVLEQALAVHPRPDIVAVGLGPGSYAGVRVAIAAAIGLQLALGCELRGVPSIAALPVVPPDYRVIGDARRGAFFSADVREGLLAGPPDLWPIEEIDQHISAAEIHYTTESFAAAPQAILLAPLAGRIAALALAPDFGGPRNALEPIYLRDPHITTARKKKPLHP